MPITTINRLNFTDTPNGNVSTLCALDQSHGADIYLELVVGQSRPDTKVLLQLSNLLKVNGGVSAITVVPAEYKKNVNIQSSFTGVGDVPSPFSFEAITDTNPLLLCIPPEHFSDADSGTDEITVTFKIPVIIDSNKDITEPVLHKIQAWEVTSEEIVPTTLSYTITTAKQTVTKVALKSGSGKKSG